MLGRDEAVDVGLAKRRFDSEYERPGGEQQQRDDEAPGQPEQHEQNHVEHAADEQGARPASEEASDPGHDESTHDLDSRHDRGGQAGDTIRGLVAIQLEEVRLRGVEHEDARPESERGGQHQPADRRIAEAAVDRAADDVAHRSQRADVALWREPLVVHEARGDEHGHTQHGRPDQVRHAQVRRLGDHAARHRAHQHGHPADRLGTSEHVLQVAGEPGRREGVHEPRLCRAREEGEPETEQDRGDGPAPERRVDLPHDQVEQGRDEQGAGTQHVRELPAAGIGDHAGRNLEEDLADGEERVRREGFGVGQARVEQEDRVDAPDERRGQGRKQGEGEIGPLDRAGGVSHERPRAPWQGAVRRGDSCPQWRSV